MKKAEHDRYFTKSDILQQIARFCAPLFTKNTLYIDFACGNNEFAKWIKDLTPAQVLSFDIVHMPEHDTRPDCPVVIQDWFTVHSLPKMPRSYKRVIVGLNPPFGKASITARQFLEHTLSIVVPDYFLLIVPYMKNHPLLQSQLYQCIYRMELPRTSFYLPDSNNQTFQWKTTFTVWQHKYHVGREQRIPR